MEMILHDYNLEKKGHLIRAAYNALSENGVFTAVENTIDDERRENAFALLMSLNMLIEFGDAFDFSGADFWSWCKEAGFKGYEVLHLGRLLQRGDRGEVLIQENTPLYLRSRKEL